jgi:RNA polymerase sigma factor (sigma-70 family)
VPPDRTEIDPAALRLLERHGRQILATARRYSASADDAEDAYQRGLEILLTKAPTTREQELVPWLKTVVKHEAFAIRRQRERATPTTDDGQPGDGAGPDAAAHDHAERYERLHMGAEALRRLKPQEVRCLVLKAEGYSYKEICRLTGWTYTKVNRCLTEGRKAFLDRVAGIEAGRECVRLAPLISKLADGEAGAVELRALRPHLRGCLVCRERLRGFRAAPARVAALAPAAVVAGHGPLRGWLESVLGAAQHKAAAVGERAHAAAELATGQKIAAVAASAAALGGGGAAGTHLHSSTRAAHAGARAAEVRQHMDARPVTTPVPPTPARQPVPPAGAPGPPPSTPARPPPAPVAVRPAHDEFGPGDVAEATVSAPSGAGDRAPARQRPPPQPEFSP